MYHFRNLIETAMANAVINGGAGVAAGADNPSELPYVYKGAGALKLVHPSVVCSVTRLNEAVEQSNVFKASCEIKVSSKADLDDADPTFDPVQEHSDNAEAVFDVFQDSGIAATLTGSGLAVMDRLLGKGFDFGHDDRQFTDTMRFEFICAITS